MELKSSSQSRVISLPDCASDPEEQEVSDDDDRNHKHRRRETRSQSLERGQPEQCLSWSYRKHGKPFKNGHLSKESCSQSQYNLEREFPSKFEKRRPSMANFSRFPSEVNQRYKHDSRFAAVDIASQIAPPGPIPPAVFIGRGLHSVSNMQRASWAGGFGLIPGIPNGAMDPIHPLGLQGSLRSPLNPSLNMGIPRQRCRDFEERGFCLRGDMCPLEHGVNHIVVEDVQSLSHFNLPVSLSSAHALGNPNGSRLGPPLNAPPSVLINGNGVSSRASKSGIDGDRYTADGVLCGVVDGSGGDVYDPDEPLWNTDFPRASMELLALQKPAIGETDSFTEADPSDRLVRSSGAGVGQSTSSSVWGRVHASKNRLELREKVDSRVSSSELPESRTNDQSEMYANVQGTSRYGKRSNAVQFVDSSSKLRDDAGCYFKKSTQKALRTLFVNGIPMKDNKKDALLSHFRKFGEVVDIYVSPSNMERAFVQFSKREEAERALKSPDAVMGNRFIKLFWANRDNIIDDGIVNGNNMPGIAHHMPEASASPLPTVANRHKDLQVSVPKASAYASDGTTVITGDGKPPNMNGPKASTAPPVQKKLENLELLKEELRKKQEMLEQKRNEFRQRLNKLQKHAIGIKGEIQEVQTAKKLKVEVADDTPKSGTPKQVNLDESGAALVVEGSVHKSQPVGNVAFHTSSKYSAAMLELSDLNYVARPPTHVGSPFFTNRYKLDNRPTAFRVNATLPNELGNLDAIRDHFEVFGDLSSVELEHLEVKGRDDDDNCSEIANISVHVSFKTRQAAEKAFINGKTWNGHSLQLTWLALSKSGSSKRENSPALSWPSYTEPQSPLQKSSSTNPHDNSGERGSLVSSAKVASSTEIQSVEKPTFDVSQDSCAGGQDSAPAVSSFTGAEAQSADKSAICTLQEASRPGGSDSEVVEKEGGAYEQMELDENISSNKD